MILIEIKNFKSYFSLNLIYRKTPQIRSAPKFESKKSDSGLGADLIYKDNAKKSHNWTGPKPEITLFR